MKISDVLLEMPLMTSPEDFGLSQPAFNQQQAQRLIGLSHMVIVHRPAACLCKTLDEYFVYDKQHQFITYYVKLVEQYVNPLGRCATQIKLWRRDAPGIAGVTKTVFDQLIATYDAVVSDSMHPTDGRRFWRDRMDEALGNNHTVGLIDHGTVKVYDHNTSFANWLQSLDAWGAEDHHAQRCFFIRR